MEKFKLSYIILTLPNLIKKGIIHSLFTTLAYEHDEAINSFFGKVLEEHQENALFMNF